MAKLLMITGRGSAADLASGKKGAFYNTLEEFRKYWDRIDIIIPRARGPASPYLRGAQSSFPRRGGPVESPLASFDNVFIHQSPWPLIFQPFWILKKGKELYREQRFDLITVHEYPPFYNGIGARMLWNKIKVPYVLEIFHIPGYPKAGNLKERIYRSLFYLFIGYDCRKPKAVRVMNSQVAQKLTSLGVPESKIKLIPAIYVDLEIFKPMNLEKKYDLIFVGRLVKNKGVNLLLEAANKLKIQNPNFKLLIVGAGPERNKLELKAKSYKLQANIIFHGWAKDSQEIAKLLNQSRVLVMPSYNEGGPRVIIEAMACGVPILATSVGIVADIIKDGQPRTKQRHAAGPVRSRGLFPRPASFGAGHRGFVQGQFGRIIDWDSQDIAEKAKSFLVNELEYQKYSGAAIEMATRFEKKSAIINYAEKLQELSTV